MASYRIELKSTVQKEIEALPKKEVARLIAKIAALAENPRPVDAVKLAGRAAYRVRVGNYRIVYEIKDDVLIVYVVKVGDRKDVYRHN